MLARFSRFAAGSCAVAGAAAFGMSQLDAGSQTAADFPAPSAGGGCPSVPSQASLSAFDEHKRSLQAELAALSSQEAIARVGREAREAHSHAKAILKNRMDLNDERRADRARELKSQSEARTAPPTEGSTVRNDLQRSPLWAGSDLNTGFGARGAV